MEDAVTADNYLMQHEMASTTTANIREITTLGPYTPNTTEADYNAVLHALFDYVPPILFFIGLPGNALSIVLVFRRSFRNSTMKPFIVALALADSSLLVLGLGRYYLHGVFDFEVSSWMILLYSTNFMYHFVNALPQY